MSPVIRNSPPAEKSLIVLLDPGHGGQDTGCVWQDQETGTLYFEKDINLDVCLRVIPHLAPNVGVRITRSSDLFISLYNRAVTPFHYDCLVSVHCNSVPAPEYDVEKVAGTEVYVRSLADAKGVEIAASFLDPVAEALGITPNLPNPVRSNSNLRVLTLADRICDRFGRSNSILRRAPGDPSRGERGHGAAALILELGYLSNSRDRKALTDPVRREACAVAIAKVINALAPKGGAYNPNEIEAPTAETAPLPDAAYTSSDEATAYLAIPDVAKPVVEPVAPPEPAAEKRARRARRSEAVVDQDDIDGI